MIKEIETECSIKRKIKSHALFQLELNKCNNILMKDKLMIKTHLANGEAQIINIFQHFNAYKCYKRLQEELKFYLKELRSNETAQLRKNVKQTDLQLKTPKFNHLKDSSLKSSPHHSFPRKKSLVLDVGLLKQESQLRGALSPKVLSNIKSKKSNNQNIKVVNTARTDQKQMKLKKVYSVGKFSSQVNHKKQHQISPFSEKQIGQSDFMKMFLMNKIKHQRQLQRTKHKIKLQQQALAKNFKNHQKDQSIFSFEIHSRNPQKQCNQDEVQFRIIQISNFDHSQIDQYNKGGIFYKKIREIIDSSQQ